MTYRRRQIVIHFALLMFFVAPMLVSAQAANSLIPCGSSRFTPCEFRHIFVFMNTLISFMLFRLAIPLATLSFMFAGFKMLTAAGNEGQIKQARAIFTDTLWGFLIALSAFVVVKFILSVVDSDFDLLERIR